MNKSSKKIQIIVDTREQTPFLWKDYADVGVQSDTLGAGDYTLCSHDMPLDDNSIIIERKKNCQELINNLGAAWDRFEIEMVKMSQYKNKLIIVCGNDNFEELYNKGYTKVHPNFAYKQLATISVRYGVNTCFLGSYINAENYVYRLFKEVINKTCLEN